MVASPISVGHKGVLLSSSSIKEAFAWHTFEDEPVSFTSMEDSPLQICVIVRVPVGHQGILIVFGTAVEETFGWNALHHINAIWKMSNGPV